MRKSRVLQPEEEESKNRASIRTIDISLLYFISFTYLHFIRHAATAAVQKKSKFRRNFQVLPSRFTQKKRCFKAEIFAPKSEPP